MIADTCCSSSVAHRGSPRRMETPPLLPARVRRGRAMFPCQRRGETRLVFLLAIIIMAGCRDARHIDSTYGHRQGIDGGSSVNGTAVLAGMFEQAGHPVKTWKWLSPKLEDYDVIVWVPNDFEPPTVAQGDYLEAWLENKNGRALVYIGRDYDASMTYWKKVQPAAPSDQASEIARRLKASQDNHDAARKRIPKQQHGRWFTVRRGGPIRASAAASSTRWCAAGRAGTRFRSAVWAVDALFAPHRFVLAGLHVADRALDLALGLGPVGTAGPDAEAPVGGEAQELGILDHLAAVGSVIVDDHRLELVEEELPGDTVEVLQGLLEAPDT